MKDTRGRNSGCCGVNHESETTIDAYNKHAIDYLSRFTEYKPYKKYISLFQKDFIQSNALEVTMLDI